MNALYLLALANLLVCSLVGFISLCRLNAMEGDVLMRVRSEYAFYIAAGTVSGFQPLIGEWPGWGSLGMSCALLGGLLCSAHAWQKDHAPAIATKPGELRRADGSPTTERGAP